MSGTIGRDDFMRAGSVIVAEALPAARRPACALHSGPQIGVVDVPPRQIGPLMSERLSTGVHDAHSHVQLCVPDGDVAPSAWL